MQVDLLRDAGQLTLSSVAVLDGVVVGHVAFSPVTLEPRSELAGLGLGPVAVHPDQQRRGIGARLIEQNLVDCRLGRWDFVVVLGDPKYYGRFGFTCAGTIGLSNDYDADEHFMVLGISSRFPAELKARVHYAPQFASLDA
jgi:putative acetyltransferase